MTQKVYVHRARVSLEPEADQRAPGGAITVALCGHWDHPGPCRWPHVTQAHWQEREGELRVVFVAGAEEESAVRALIDEALQGGRCVGPDGVVSWWVWREGFAEAPTPREEEMGMRMAGSLPQEDKQRGSFGVEHGP